MVSTLTNTWQCSTSQLQRRAITGTDCKRGKRASLLILNLRSEDRAVLQTNLRYLETDEETEEASKNNVILLIIASLDLASISVVFTFK
jgi:hypothetical protein